MMNDIEKSIIGQFAKLPPGRQEAVLDELRKMLPPGEMRRLDPALLWSAGEEKDDGIFEFFITPRGRPDWRGRVLTVEDTNLYTPQILQNPCGFDCREVRIYPARDNRDLGLWAEALKGSTLIKDVDDPWKRMTLNLQEDPVHVSLPDPDSPGDEWAFRSDAAPLLGRVNGLRLSCWARRVKWQFAPCERIALILRLNTASYPAPPTIAVMIGTFHVPVK